MQITFNRIVRSWDETELGHCLWFYPILTSDAISATANSKGFTPLKAIAREYGWSYNFIEMATASCANQNEVILFDQMSPKLMLVPRANTIDDIEKFANSLFKMIADGKIMHLHFTHFGFLQGKLASENISAVFRAIKNLSDTGLLKSISIDVDARKYEDVVRIWNSTTNDPMKSSFISKGSLNG